MSKFHVKVTLGVEGKPDVTHSFAFKDEASFAKAQTLWMENGLAFAKYREANPHDAALAAGTKTLRVAGRFLVLRDGRIHMEDPGMVWHDLPEPAVKWLEDSLASFIKHADVSPHFVP